MSKSLLQVMCAFSCSSTSCGSVHFVVRTPSLYVCVVVVVVGVGHGCMGSIMIHRPM